MTTSSPGAQEIASHELEMPSRHDNGKYPSKMSHNRWRPYQCIDELVMTQVQFLNRLGKMSMSTSRIDTT